MRLLRRILRVVGFLVLLLVALAVGAGAVLTLTEKGRDNLAGLISTMASSPDSAVAVSGISGIWWGPTKVDSVVLSDRDGAWLALRGVAVDWSFWPLLSSRFEASLVHADRVELARLPAAGEGGGGGGLPLSLSIGRIDLPEIMLGDVLAGQVAKVSAEGSLQAEAEPMVVKADLKVRRTDGREGAVDARIDFAPTEDRLAIDVHGSEPAGGIIANLLQLPGAPPVELSLSGTGPAANWDMSGTFAVDGAVITKISGKRQLTDKGNRIEAKGEGAFERFIPREFASLLAGNSTFEFAGTIGDAGAIDIERASLVSGVLTAHAAGAVYPSGVTDLGIELAARDAPATLVLGEGAAAVTLAVKSASVRAFGPGGAPILDVVASLDRIATSEVELSGIEAKLHSDAFDLAGRTGPLTLSATAARGGSADATIAALLAGVLRLEAAATLSPDNVHVDSGSFASDAVGAAVSGDVSLADGSLKLDAKVNMLSTVLPEAARPALDPNVAVSATVSRDASGTLRLDPLSVASGGFSAGGAVSYAAGALDAQLGGAFADLTKLSPEVGGAIAFQVTAKGNPAAPDVVATISSDRLTAAGREVTALELSANGKADAANPAANLAIKGTVAGEALAGEAVLTIADGRRRIDGISLTLGRNSVTGALALNDELVPEGTLALALPDIAPLAALVPEDVAGALDGTARFTRVDGVPHVAIEAKVASLRRGDVAVGNAELTAEIADYFVAPAVSGQVKAASVASGATEITGVDVALAQRGPWTEFSGGAVIADIAARATGRLALADGTTTIELASASADTRGLAATLEQPATVTVRDGVAALDRLTLAVGSGTVEISGRAAEQLDLDLRLTALPAGIVATFAPQVTAAGALSGSVRVSGNPAALLGNAGQPGTADLAADLAPAGEPLVLTVGEGPAAPVLTLSALSLRAAANGALPAIDLTADLDRIVTPQAELTDVAVKLHSDAFDLAARAGSVTLSAAAGTAGSADVTTAALLAGAPKLDAVATLAADNIHIDSGSFVSDTVGASVAGDVSLADGSLKLDARVDMLAVVLPEAARPALDRNVAVTATVSRDSSGALRLDPLSVASGALDAAGTVSYAADAIDARLSGAFADLTKLSPDISGAIAFDITARGAPAAPDVVATVTSDRLVAAGREITALELSANGKADAANPAANLAIKGNVAGEALAGQATLATADGQRRIDGLSLTLGRNSVSGSLVLDEAFVPEGALALALPDIAPLAALAPDNAAGAASGTVRFTRVAGVPHVAVEASAPSLRRGDLAVSNAEITADVADYLVAPAVSGKVRAASVRSGTTVVSNVDVSLTRDGSWTGFTGGALIADVAARAAGRVAVQDGATTIELASASADMRGLTAALAQPTVVTVKDAGATFDRLTLTVGSGTVEVSGTAAEALDLDIRVAALPAEIASTFAPQVKASGALSGSVRVSGNPAALLGQGGAGPADLAADLAASGEPVILSSGEGTAAATLALEAASLHVAADGGLPAIDLSADLDKVAISDVELAGVAAKLHSDGFDIVNRSGPLTIAATAASGRSADATIAAALAGALKLDATATASADSVDIAQAAFASDTVSATAGGRVSLADGSLGIDVNADLLATLLPAALRPALAERVDVKATVARDAAGAFRVDPLTILSGPFDAAGTIAYAPAAIDVRLKGGLDDIAKLAPDTSGAIGFDIGATGSPAAPDIVATISSDRFTAVGREITGLEFSASGKADLANPAASVTIKGNVAGEALAGEAVLKTADGERRIDGLSLTLGQNSITGDLVLDEAFVPEGALAFTLPDIGPLAALALDQASGSVSGTIRFSRADRIPQLAVDARAASIQRGDLSVKNAEVTALVANYLLAPVVSGKVKAQSVTSGTTVVSNIDVSLTRDGSWTGFSGGAIANGIEARAAGRVAVAGGITTVELASSTAAMRGLTASLARPTTVVVKGGGATLDRLTLNVSGGSVQVTGTAAEQLNLDVQLSALPASVADAFAPGIKATGTVSGSVRVSGAAVNPNIGYQLEMRNAQTQQTRDAGFGAMTVSSTGTFSGGVLKFTSNVGDGSGLGLQGGGTVNTGARNLSLDFSGQVPFGFLTRRLAAQGLALSGTSNVSLTLRGSLSAPAVGGRITASGVRLVDARSGLAVDGIQADVAVASGVATLRRLTGTLSSGGTLSASGTVGIDAAKGFPADLRVRIADARYTDGRIVTANLDGEVTLKGALTGQPLLSGTINLAKTVITIPDRLPGSAATLGVRHKNAPAAVRRQDAAIRPETSSGNSGSGLTLDLTVNAPQRIFVRGRGLDAELGGSIRLTGPLAAPRAQGQFTLRRGRLTLLSRRLDFTRGTLGFSGSLIPTIDFAAESATSDATVTVGVTGFANDPRFTFTSSPTLPQDEVLARLVFGRSMSHLSALQIAQLADAAAQLAGRGGSSSLLNSLRGKLGVDDLDLKTNAQGGTSVSAGKYLNDRTYVTIEKGDKAGSGKATIDLDVGRGVKLRGEAGEDGSAKGGIFFEREY